MLTLMKVFFTSFILFFSLVVASIAAIAQTPSENSDPIYGYDPLLYNGRLYYFYPQPGTQGTQYLFDKFDSTGSITVRSTSYTNLTLNFDIYNQLLIMKYKNAIGSPNLIEISYAWLEKASLWGTNFETFAEPNSAKRLYQVIGDGDEKIMYYLSKDLLIDNLKSSKSHYFTSGKKAMYVLTHGLLIPFKNNNGFTKAFNQTKQSFIKEYLRIHDINVKTANDFIMTNVINYCNSLPIL